MFKKVDTRKKYSEMEKEILKFWKEDKTFEKLVEMRSTDNPYSFYDGPPFITGVPHHGTLLTSIIKDCVPRYWTMKGYRVERRWGWDCHGLPAENIVENKLGSRSKKDIEEKIGIDKFNQECFNTTCQISNEWEEIIDRIGRWVEFKGAYKTMDQNYMESVWWAFKQLYEKNLIYEDVRVSLYCPRCSTPLSNFEIAMDNSYEMDKDPSTYVKMKLKTKNEKLKTNENVYFLVWTTTPWTLPANVALAIGKDIEYALVKIKTKSEKRKTINQNLTIFFKESEEYILAKEKIKDILEEGVDYEIIQEFKGKELINWEYEPIFSRELKMEDDKKGYRVIATDFVTTEEGTGIVHIAPAFGEDDFQARKEHNLPIILNVDEEGKFAEGKWRGINVWEANGQIVGWLKEKGFLFKKQNIAHSYPHCHRCHTKLIYKAQPAWFVKINEIKGDLLKNNEKINWYPEFLKEGRFKKGIESAPDWNISRDRYWGTPMPVWRCDKCGKIKIIGSTEEINSTLGKFFVIRHGEAESNIRDIFSSQLNDGLFLTPKGKKDIEKMAKELKNKKIDIIFSSDLDRAKETSEKIGKMLKVETLFDERLREVNMGDFNGRDIKKEKEFVEKWRRGEELGFPKGENWHDLEKRAEEFYRDIFKNYRDKNILIVSHGDLLTALEAKLSGKNYLKRVAKICKNNYIKNAELREFNHKIINLHRPDIDEIKFRCEDCGCAMKRIPQVFDCWLESGSMSFAQFHYPFENREKFEKSFPADFISEYIAQTRAWFYVMHVMAVAIFGSQAYKNVLTTGTIAGNDGRKMSKSFGNYTDPKVVLEKYSADALRFYFLSSPLMKAQNINFSEETIKDIQRKFLGTLWNSYSFFVLYANVDKFKPKKGFKNKNLGLVNLLDKWILSELNQLIKEVDKSMQKYDLTGATKPMEEFVDNLSNWYIRRSRRRFWKSESDEDKNQAYQTLWTVLTEFSKALAPFCPFVADEIYRNLMGVEKTPTTPQSPPQARGEDENVEARFIASKESVHLCDFPEADEKMIDEKLNKNMEITRKIIELSLSLRAENGIKVRQPLNKLQITNYKLQNDFLDLIKDEVNIKEIEIINKLEEAENIKVKEEKEIKVGLNIKITPKLKLEGQMRELVRHIQQARKEADFQVDDRIKLFYQGGNEIMKKYGEIIKREVLAVEIKPFNNDEFDFNKKFKIDGKETEVWLKKQS